MNFLVLAGTSSQRKSSRVISFINLLLSNVFYYVKFKFRGRGTRRMSRSRIVLRWLVCDGVLLQAYFCSLLLVCLYKAFSRQVTRVTWPSHVDYFTGSTSTKRKCVLFIENYDDSDGLSSEFPSSICYPHL